jgi:outer membrane biosynthesis protein TonB
VHRDVSGTRLGGPIGLSVLLHASIIGAAVFVRPGPPKAMPVVTRVNLIAAPAGERAIGTLTPQPAPPPTAPTAPPPRAETNPRDMPAPTKKPVARKAAPATPTLPTKAAPKDVPLPKAGGGPTGGTGTDVANIRTEGVEFTDQAYLNNIVRQIAVRFKPRNPGALRADVFFIVKRDGSVGDFRFLTKSNVYAFDLEAQGAVEAAGSARAFGALPPNYVNDFLPVIFSFDPSLIR